MTKEISAIDDARFIYNFCIDIQDARKHLSNHWWINQPKDYKNAVWGQLINLCETHGYFKGGGVAI